MSVARSDVVRWVESGPWGEALQSRACVVGRWLESEDEDEEVARLCARKRRNSGEVRGIADGFVCRRAPTPPRCGAKATEKRRRVSEERQHRVGRRERGRHEGWRIVVGGRQADGAQQRSVGLRRVRSAKALDKSTCVLVVDDDEQARKATMARLLCAVDRSSARISVAGARSAQEADDRVEAGEVRLVLVRRRDESLVDRLERRERGPIVAVLGGDAVAFPLSTTAANRLLWRYVIPHGDVKLSAQQPLSSLVRDLGPAVLEPLGDGGLRGLLALLHSQRRAAAGRLDAIAFCDPDTCRRERRTPAVLVLDDAPDSPGSVADAVDRLDARCRLVSCADDRQAAAAVDDASLCFVLCLVDLTRGPAAARALRAKGVSAALVALASPAAPALTPDDLSRNDAVALAFDDVITKPLLPADLDALLANSILPTLSCLDRDRPPDRPTSA